MAWKLTNHATILNVGLCFGIQMLDFVESVGLIGEEPFNTLNGWIVSESEASIPMVFYVSRSARTPLYGKNLFCIKIPNWHLPRKCGANRRRAVELFESAIFLKNTKLQFCGCLAVQLELSKDLLECMIGRWTTKIKWGVHCFNHFLRSQQIAQSEL